jgi:hypothetical protein
MDGNQRKQVAEMTKKAAADLVRCGRLAPNICGSLNHGVLKEFKIPSHGLLSKSDCENIMKPLLNTGIGYCSYQ